MVAGIAELNMAGVPRLSPSTLASLHSSVARPTYRRDEMAVGQVHLGVGAFMRAHIAAYNDQAMNLGDSGWGIAGVSLRRPDVREQLQPQDGLYTLAACDNERQQYRLIGAIKSVAVAPEDPARVIRQLADPEVRVVTLTVTEKGYSIEPESGALAVTSNDIRHDLANPAAPKSTVGFLVAGLAMRKANNAGPISIVSCDNLPHNGARLCRALYEFAEHARTGLAGWLDDNCRFPATMVDRIVPATTPADIEAAGAAIGVHDAALVRTEPFAQWVIQDDFAAARPDWHSAGAQLVDNVEPYELAKLRFLNGPHSALAYLGYLGGYEHIHDVMQNEDYVTYARHMMSEEISPSTPQPDGMLHADYIDELLARFRNRALNHRTWQIAMDGSQKLPQRILNTVRLQLKKGGPFAGLALAVAAWIRYTQGRDERGEPIEVSDPLAERFADIARETSGEPDDLVNRYVAIDEVFGTDLAGQRRFTSTLAGQLRQLLDKGAAKTVAEFSDSC